MVLSTILRKRLEAIASEEGNHPTVAFQNICQQCCSIPVLTLTQDVLRNLSGTDRGEQVLLVRQRQEKLAFAFRDRITRGRLFQAPNDYRNTFYKDVIELVREVNFHASRQFSDVDKSF